MKRIFKLHYINSVCAQRITLAAADKHRFHSLCHLYILTADAIRQKGYVFEPPITFLAFFSTIAS